MKITRGVIFDMDGVLCDSEPFICEAACRMFQEEHGIRVAPADFIPFVGAGEDRYLGGVAEKYGVQLDMPHDKERTYAIYLEIICGRLAPLPGVREFIDWCREQNVRMAVASSADRVKVDGNLREIGVPTSSFDACICGSDVVHKKPAPDIFLKAAELIQVPPVRSVVVEDAVNGIQAGVAAGARCLGVTTSFSADTLRQAGAHWVAPHLASVPKDVYGFLQGGLRSTPAAS